MGSSPEGSGPQTPSPVLDAGWPRRPFIQRLRAALRLHADLFEEIEHDPSALGQAAVVVLVGGACRGLGALGTEGLAGFLGSVLVALVAWLGFTGVIVGIGVGLLGARSGFVELLRTTGFAAVPLWLLAVAALPLGPFRPALVLGAHAAAAWALVVAVRQALDVDTTRALVIVLVGLALGVVLGLAVGIAFFGEAALYL